MNTALKKAIEELFEISKEYVEASEETGGDGEDELKKDCVDFLSYLSAADGTISEYEAEFITVYLEHEFDAAELKEYIEENNTYSVEFEERLPHTFKCLLNRDNEEFEKNSLQKSFSKAFISVFECMGKEFIVCDGNASDQEVTDFSTYINNLRTFLNRNSKFPADVESAISTGGINRKQENEGSCAGDEEEPSLEELLDELNNLVGLDAVKSDVNSLIHLQEIQKIRESRGLKKLTISNHLVFYGNPGTGKTTVARLLARIYHAMGIISKGQCVEVDRSGLVAGYVGQTALKVQAVIEEALGGVLFIDEAYSLTSYSGNDYGGEAVDTILKAMEDNRDDLIVIVAGYPDLMAQFIDSNPGLRSRFNKYINFEDYSLEALTEIFKTMCKNAGYVPTEEAIDEVIDILQNKQRNKDRNFANAREVRNLFEKAVMKQADRLFGAGNPTDEELCALEISDVKGIQ